MTIKSEADFKAAVARLEAIEADPSWKCDDDDAEEGSEWYALAKEIFYYNVRMGRLRRTDCLEEAD